MELTLWTFIVYIIIPVISIMVIPFFRNIFMRIRELETQIQHKVTDTEVRQLLEDKIDPVKQDLQEIKAQLNQIINRLIDKS